MSLEMLLCGLDIKDRRKYDTPTLSLTVNSESLPWLPDVSLRAVGAQIQFSSQSHSHSRLSKHRLTLVCMAVCVLTSAALLKAGGLGRAAGSG